MCYAGYDQVRTVKRCKCRKGDCRWRGSKDRQCVTGHSLVTPAPAFEQVCEPLENPDFGNWHCSHGSALGSRCKLRCESGFTINSNSPARRCRCSNRQQMCMWTRHTLECKPEDDPDIWITPKPTHGPGVCHSLFIDPENPRDEYPNGEWTCYKKREQISLLSHNSGGIKCRLRCDEGFEVIPDGDLRRCRFHQPTDRYRWSGRIRYCRTPAENARILAEEALARANERSERKEERHNARVQTRILANDFIEIESELNNFIHGNTWGFQEEPDEKEEEDYQDPKRLQHEGHTYVHSFGFLQFLQRLMYENGLFNFEPRSKT